MLWLPSALLFLVTPTWSASSSCQDADWTLSFDKPGWSVCPSDNTYIRGLYRNFPAASGLQGIYLIEKARCCQATEPSYTNQGATCTHDAWSDLVNTFLNPSKPMWAECPRGYFVNGFKITGHVLLSDIQQAKCCRPQNHPDEYDGCYDEDVTLSFDDEGWSECKQAGYFMTGFYKGVCQEVYCIEKFRCCKMKNVGVNGGWNEWGDWGQCSSSCGSGEAERTRTCTNPPPAGEGSYCLGSDKETKRCKMPPCPVDGGWSEWGDWGECSESCGSSQQERSRTCTSPPPSAGGADCIGHEKEVKQCNMRPCSGEGGWSQWTEYGDCNKTCGNGRQYRHRTCTNPPPSGKDKKCKGKNRQYRKCKVRTCKGTIRSTNKIIDHSNRYLGFANKNGKQQQDADRIK